MSLEKAVPAGDESLDRLVRLFEQTNEYFQQKSAQSINRNLVIRNWLLGCYIVEFEQHGAERARHGEGLIKGLAKKLKEKRFRGGSLSSLKQIRAFYLANREIGQTPSGFLSDASSSPENTAILTRVSESLPLSWSHYVTLLSIDDQSERRFYEIEASQNNWGVREL
ncbi:DUF1016 N-terminal domain-containing protein, partial [Roseimaritima sediminicola]|uniref:DUF1016 N-terminal domain-containing protein n=1 Tax=Roseimaritima sediminicola TaxID=2662066 RepID=UPI00129850DA